MKLVLVSIIVVLAVAAGIAVGGVLTQGFFVLTSSAAAPGSDALVQDDAGQASAPEFRIKIGSKSGGDAESADDEDNAAEEKTEEVQENETVEELASIPATVTGSVTSSRSSHSSASSNDNDNSDDTGTEPDEPIVPDEPKANVYISPDSVDADVNSVFTVSVYLDTEVELYAASVTLTYDSDVLKYLSADEGDFFSLDGSSTFKIIKTGSDYVKYDSTRYETADGYSGEGTLFVVWRISAQP